MIQTTKDDLTKNRGLLKLHESFISDEEYDSSKYLSYSKVKDVYDNPESLFEERKESKAEWLTFGTVVDIMLTDEEHLWDRIMINDTVPSDQMKNITEYIVNNNLIPDNIDNNLSTDIGILSDTQIEECYTNTGSSVRWTIDTKRKKIAEECSEYYKLLKVGVDKMIISTELYDEADNLATLLRTEENTKHLFMSESDQLKENIEILYQFKIKYVFEEMMCKSKIDIVVIDHDLEIVSLYDIKTGSDHPRKFLKQAIYKYKYGYQAVLYQKGFEEFIKSIPQLTHYKIEDFRFVYVSRIKPNYAVVARISSDCLKEFYVCGINDYNYTIPSVSETFEAIRYYTGILDSGEKPYMPYDIALKKGEYVIPMTKKYYD